MDFGRSFAQSWHILKTHWVLWGLGFLGAIGGLLLQLYLFFMMGDFSLTAGNQEQVAEEITSAILDTQKALLFLGGLLLVLVVVWLTTAIAEAGLIWAVAETEQPQPKLTPPAVFQHALAGVWRLVVLDTLILFPLFVVVLIMLLGVLAAVVYLVSRSTALNDTDILQSFSFLLFCLACTTCISLPISLLTIWFRLISFRYNLIRQMGAWESLAATRQLLRTQFFNIFILWVISLLGGVFISVADGTIEVVFSFFPVALGAPLAFLGRGVVGGLWYTAHSVLWTVSFQQLTTTQGKEQ